MLRLARQPAPNSVSERKRVLIASVDRAVAARRSGQRAGPLGDVPAPEAGVAPPLTLDRAMAANASAVGEVAEAALALRTSAGRAPTSSRVSAGT